MFPNLSGGTETATRNFSQVNWCIVWDSNRTSPEYTSEW